MIFDGSKVICVASASVLVALALDPSLDGIDKDLYSRPVLPEHTAR